MLQQGLALRDRYNHHEISLHGLFTATGRLEVKLDRVLAQPGRDAANLRFAKHLLHERLYIFMFLYCPGLDATNNVSERAIRALIGARKNWAAIAPHGELALRPCSPAFCKPPNSRTRIPSMFCWNYWVPVTSTRFSILSPPEKHTWTP